MAITPATISDIHRAQRADGPAAVLAIGTATPANCVPQDEYADYYFRVTNSEHLTKLKDKMKRICEKSGIKKRYFHQTDELLRRHPELLDRRLPSLDARLAVTEAAVPELAAAAAAKAIAEWGRPAADITHLVACTMSGAHMPGADLRLASLLGLSPSVRRTMLYLHGCYAFSGALRVAKDLAENNRGARVLVACADINFISFRALDDDPLNTLITQSLLGDGAGAVIIGADAENSVEHPIFHMVSATQTFIPDTDRIVTGQLGIAGLDARIGRELPTLVGDNIEQCLADALRPLAINCGWNDLFWAVHPGGRAILDKVEEALGLGLDKLAASRRVLSEYGNMVGATLIFVLDELRRRQDDGEWGVMLGFGPGITIETMVLHAAAAARYRPEKN